MFNLSVQYSPGYLLIVTSGTARMAEFCASTSFLADLARQLAYRKVLLDMLSLDMELGPGDTSAVIEHVRQWWPPIDRLAYVQPPGTSYGILATVCESRGIASQEFDSLAAAEKWLAG